MNIRMQYCKTQEGHSIAYGVIGEGPPVVVAGSVWGDIHMSAVRDSIWHFYPVATRRVVLYDGLGMGASDHSSTDYSLQAKLRDLETVVNHLGLETFAIFGRFNAVPSAIAYAAAHPEKVTAIVLVNGVASGREWYSTIPAMRIAAGLSDMAEEQWEAFTMALASAVTDYRQPELAAELAGLFRSSMTASEYLSFLREFMEIDVRDLLPSIQIPTLLVNVSDRLSGVLPLMRSMAAAIPGATLMQGSVEEATLAIEQFLAETDPLSALARSESSFRTVLFTDLVGHTSMMQRLGDEKGRDVLREHERITREVLKANGGTEVKTMGDGFLASFGSVTRAVECAVALQKAFEEESMGAGEHLQVRCGLNAGEPIEEDGDLFGSAVILASRIAAKAGGGEVLVANAVRELCTGKGFLFVDRGEFVAKGFEEAVRVYEVKWRDRDDAALVEPRAKPSGLIVRGQAVRRIGGVDDAGIALTAVVENTGSIPSFVTSFMVGMREPFEAMATRYEYRTPQNKPIDALTLNIPPMGVSEPITVMAFFDRPLPYGQGGRARIAASGRQGVTPHWTDLEFQPLDTQK